MDLKGVDNRQEEDLIRSTCGLGYCGGLVERRQLSSGPVLHMVAVVIEVVLEPAGQWQVLDLPSCLVDGDAAQVL